MRTLPAIVSLLERCDSADAARPILELLGFDTALIPLRSSSDFGFRLSTSVRAAHLASGEGALRALVIELAPGSALRDEVMSCAKIAATRFPHLFWIILAVSRAGHELAIAGVDPSSPAGRIKALVVNRAAVVDSDAETVCRLADARGISDVFTHARWLEILGRDAIGLAFFRGLERAIERLAASLSPLPPVDESRELALLYASRLLFLCFLETKGWLAGDHAFLVNRFAECMLNGGRYHDRVLRPLFFGTLNTKPRDRARRARLFGAVPFLNGGLFARSVLERRMSASSFTDEAIGDLFAGVLTKYRFTAREDSSAWSEAAVDPEMLGRTFESLMSSRTRKRSGAFFTPQPLVSRICRSALAHCLATPSLPTDALRQILDGGKVSDAAATSLRCSLDGLTVLDPACGSGAFLVFLLEEVSSLRARAGDTRPSHVIRREVLTRSIFGVDVNPTAVWLCELRLWLSMAIDDPERDPMRVTPLPNLDRNVRTGDSLSGQSFRASPPFASGRRVAALRARYVRAVGARKRAIAAELDRVERRIATTAASREIDRLSFERRENLIAARAPDLFGPRRLPDPHLIIRGRSFRRALSEARARLHQLRVGGALPFSFSAGFPDVHQNGGFAIVVGNPPWVRTHNLPAAFRQRLASGFQVYRHASWQGGSTLAGAGRGFASQVDAASLFIERSVELARSGGVVALLVPSKLWRSLAGGGVRSFLLGHTNLRELHDLGEDGELFDAAVYPSAFIAKT